MLTPTVVRTWAPRGQTPIFRHSQRHDRISAISVSPTRRRVGLYYQWHHNNIHDIEAVAFLRHLLRHLRGDVVLIWDNLGVHKGKLVKQLCRRVPRLHLEYLPAVRARAQPGRGCLAPRQRPARQRLSGGPLRARLQPARRTRGPAQLPRSAVELHRERGAHPLTRLASMLHYLGAANMARQRPARLLVNRSPQPSTRPPLHGPLG
jgi:hypothetical protein